MIKIRALIKEDNTCIARPKRAARDEGILS
jgi:hypothetical protein